MSEAGTSAPSADETIAAFREAARVQNESPLRRGCLTTIGPDAADDVFVSADLHAHRKNFESILAKAELDRRPRRHLILQEVCHGGPCYADGGCMSHRMLEDVARLVAEYSGRVHFLLSNHELAELTDYPIMKSRKMLNVLFRMGLVNAYGREADRVRQAALEFIQSSPLGIRIGERTFVSHSLPERLDWDPFDATVFERSLRPGDLMEEGAAFRIVWGRDFREENVEIYLHAVQADVLLSGHEPAPAGYQLPNSRQIILDCCHDEARCAIVPTSGPIDQTRLVQKLVKL